MTEKKDKNNHEQIPALITTGTLILSKPFSNDPKESHVHIVLAQVENESGTFVVSERNLFFQKDYTSVYFATFKGALRHFEVRGRPKTPIYKHFEVQAA